MKKLFTSLAKRGVLGITFGGALLAFIGCSKETAPVDPQNPILGKWVLILRDEIIFYRQVVPDGTNASV